MLVVDDGVAASSSVRPDQFRLSAGRLRVVEQPSTFLSVAGR